jgi:hypothetical protein
MSYPLRRPHFTDTTARPLAPHPQHRTRPLRSRTLALWAEPEPQQKLRRQPRDVVAGRTIDLDEITTPQILNPPDTRAAFRSPFLELPAVPVNKRSHLIHAPLLRGFLRPKRQASELNTLVTAADLTAIKRQGDGVRVGGRGCPR